MNNVLLLIIEIICTFVLILGTWNRSYFALTVHDQRLNLNIGRMLSILSIVLLGTFYYWEMELGVDLDIRRYPQGFGYFEHVVALCGGVLLSTVCYHIVLWFAPRFVIRINRMLGRNY